MIRTDNYAIQAQSAKARFLTYDQEKIIQKFRLEHDADYLYPVLLGDRYRLCRRTCDIQLQTGDGFADANGFDTVMTLLDLLCDAKDSRSLSGRYQQQQHFGLLFHQKLLADRPGFLALAFDRDEPRLRAACAAIGAVPFPGGDFGCTAELFDGLSIGLLFWHGDEEFAPRLRFFWDENALMWLRYETMYYATSLLEEKLRKSFGEMG